MPGVGLNGNPLQWVSLSAALLLSGCVFSRTPIAIVPSPPKATAAGYRIDEPEVRQRITEYPTVTFTPGEVIRITAGGCVQTGGHGKTWKRYVNPEGADGSRLYHGLVWIPGVTPGLMRVGWLNGKRLKIPADADPSDLFLRLGYEDDYYRDNGYYKHDSGTNSQCKDQGNAWLEIQRQSAGDPDPLALSAFDLTLEMKDGIGAKPVWVYYATHSTPPDAEQASLCGHFKGDDGEIKVDPETCSTQQPGVDYPTLSSLHTVVCHMNDVLHPELLGKLHGHANWSPGSYTGNALYTGISADRDVNFLLQVEGPSATTAYPSPPDGGIELEFASDETVYHFGTPWWENFAAKARDKSAIRSMLTGRVVVTGLIGIDNEHEAHAEVHPVYGIALQTADAPAGEDVWAVFVRNWGDEGFCSQDRHYVDLPRNRFVLEIPWPGGATGVDINYPQPGDTSSVTRSFRTNSSQAAVGVPIVLPDRRVVRLTFELPPPQESGRIAGEVHLRWANVRRACPACYGQTSGTRG